MNDLDFLDDMEAGECLPITERQRNTLYKLIGNAILTPDQKEGYRRALDCKITFNEAEGMQQELRAIQLNALQKYNPYVSEVNAELKKLVDRDNN